ncbi:hypothetical protein SCUCBS95973_000125 [Sporothrix curviconia]|uniref:F-box domain-containing protein n=1 Tax=Sporothrix curviconia TaxID=1260050 RepID=A0ABP0AMA2_9PEZI
MDAFLAAALAPKAGAKRRAVPKTGGQDGDNSSSNFGSASSSSATAAKRPRPRADRLAKEPKTVADRTTIQTMQTPAAGSGPAMPSAPAPAPQNAPLPSFLATVAGQGIRQGPSRTRTLVEKAAEVQGEGRLKRAHTLLTRALIMCACHTQLRNQFKDVGASLDAIDPIGQCSCRDFVAAAQKRRSQTMSTRMGLAAPTEAAGDAPAFSITELDLESVYVLSTGEGGCTCGSGRIRCSEPDHLAALDRLAAVTSKMGRIDETIRLGQWYVDLAPHHAQGYLHLAKAVLVKAAPKPMDTRPDDDVRTECERARFAARCLYTHGVHNVCKYGSASDGLLQVLQRCCRQYSHGDYLPDLPVETVEAVFQHLSMNDILACRQVSKRWGLVLRRIRLRPLKICFHGRKEAPTKGLQSLLRQLPGLQTDHLAIIYPDSTDALKSAQFVTGALRHFSSVETLELRMWSCQSQSSSERIFPKAAVTTSPDGETTIKASLGSPPLPPLPAVSKCRRLVLHNSKSHLETPARCFMAWASQSVEYLELNGKFYSEPFDFRLPKLRHTKITDSTWASHKREFDFILSTCTATVQLEQLFLENIFFQTTYQREDALVAKLEESFQHLHTLVIGYRCRVQWSVRDDIDMPSTFLVFPQIPPGIRCIDIVTNREKLAHSILFGGDYQPRSNNYSMNNLRPLENLEMFRCLSPVDTPRHLFQLIEPSLNGAEGRLAHLELNAYAIRSSFLDGNEPGMHIAYPERLKTVGLYDFNWSPLGGMGGGSSASLLRDRVFLDWVAQFRNAETICMYPAWRNGAWSGDGGEGGRMVVALVEQTIRQAEADAKAKEGNSDRESVAKHLKLRTIYQGMLNGAMKDFSVKLIGDLPIDIPPEHYDFRPPIFPWPDREEE